MAIHPDRTLVATGQVASVLDNSYDAAFLCVWDTRDLTRVSRITFQDEGGASARYVGMLRACLGGACVCWTDIAADTFITHAHIHAGIHVRNRVRVCLCAVLSMSGVWLHVKALDVQSRMYTIHTCSRGHLGCLPCASVTGMWWPWPSPAMGSAWWR